MTIKSINSQESNGAFGWLIHDVTSHPLLPYNVLLIIEYKTSDKNMFIVYVCIVCKNAWYNIKIRYILSNLSIHMPTSCFGLLYANKLKLISYVV